MGLSELIKLVTLVALAAPSAPSPAAATIKGAPLGGVVPDVGVNVPVLTGGWVIPLLKFNPMEAGLAVV